MGYLQQEGTIPTQELVKAQSQDQGATSPLQEPTELPGWLDTQETSRTLKTQLRKQYANLGPFQLRWAASECQCPMSVLHLAFSGPGYRGKGGPECGLLALCKVPLHHRSLQAQGGVLWCPHEDVELPRGCVAPLQPDERPWALLFDAFTGPCCSSSLGFQLPTEHREVSEALSLVPKAPSCPPTLPGCPSGHSSGTPSFTGLGPPRRYPGTKRQTVPKSHFSWQKQQLASNEASCFIFR